MKNVEMINEHMDQMQQLCTSYFVTEAKATETEQTGNRLSYKTVQQAIAERLNEYTHFCDVRDQLLHLCNDLADKEAISIKGINIILNSVSHY